MEFPIPVSHLPELSFLQSFSCSRLFRDHTSLYTSDCALLVSFGFVLVLFVSTSFVFRNFSCFNFVCYVFLRFVSCWFDLFYFIFLCFVSLCSISSVLFYCFWFCLISFCCGFCFVSSRMVSFGFVLLRFVSYSFFLCRFIPFCLVSTLFVCLYSFVGFVSFCTREKFGFENLNVGATFCNYKKIE